MKALSVRAPWWWFILQGKDIENRGPHFPRTVIGGVWLHSSKWWDQEEVEWDLECGMEMAHKAGVTLPDPDLTLMRSEGGRIVGSVEIVRYVEASESPWFMGETGLVLRNPVPLTPTVPLRGMLGFFAIPDGLIGDAA